MTSVRKALALSLLVLPLAACHRGDSAKVSLPPAPEAQAPGAGEALAATTSPEAASTPETPAAPPPKPAPAAASIEYRLTGQVTSVRKSQIAFRVDGIIQNVAAKAGFMAKKGDVLASLDDRDFVLRLELAKAKRDSVKVAGAEAERDFQREQELKKDNASTAVTFDRAKAASDQSKIALKLAELDVQTAEYALRDTKLTAPYDCVIATQWHYDGENLKSGVALFDVYDTSAPEVTLAAPERMLGQLKVGSKLKLSVPALGYSGAAEITRLVPVVSDKTRTFPVTASLHGGGQQLAPGSYAEATLD